MGARTRSARRVQTYSPDGLTEGVIEALIKSIAAEGSDPAVTTAVADGSAAAAKRRRMRQRATVATRHLAVPSHTEAA